jgi:Zn-dependent protease
MQDLPPDPSNDEIVLPTIVPAESMDETFAPVYQEIERLANSKSSWTNTILTLLISAAIFAALAQGGSGWQPLALLIGVLVFHELGHLAAMRMFGYRNLRMFFIPFFGAAASGRSYDVSGWKRAVVSLMGPLPGIVVGLVLGILAAKQHSLPLLEAALLLLAINALNLLPIVPLDGGRLMEVTIFARHPVFDAIFRAIAAGVLMLGWFIGLRVLAILGVFMLLGLPMSFRLGRVVHRLRKQGFDASSPDGQTVPWEKAQAIHAEIVQALPRPLHPKAAAQWTLGAFSALNGKPPGWLASIALVIVQGLTLLIALFGLAVLYIPFMLFRADQAIQVNPSDAKAYYNRGWANKTMDLNAEAVTDYTKAIELGQNTSLAYYDRGYAYERLGQYEPAIADFTRAINIDPKLATALCERGSCYAATGKKDQARADLQRALEQSPLLQYRIKKISDRYNLEGPSKDVTE